MTWDEIYETAMDKGFGDFELKRKDNARYEVVLFVEENFGFNLEYEGEENVIECVEDWIEYYTEKYNISFDEEGHIIKHNPIELKDKAIELVMFYDDLPDRPDKDFDTLEIVMEMLRTIKEFGI